jgi:ADP-ribosylation factor protein 1
MGNIGTTMKEYFFKPKSYRIVIGGLDAAGKTTVLYKLKLGEVVTTIPTIGFNVETVSCTSSMKGSSVDFVMWDVGGRDKSRTLFLRHYAPNSSAILMCVDSNDRERIDEVREYIDNILKIEGLEGVPLLVFANKQDIKGAMTPEEVEDALHLHNIKDRPYRESSVLCDWST